MEKVKSPKVSIIMPVFNCEQDVKGAIESIQRLMLREWELIVIDDCSSDNTYSVVNEYVLLDSRIKLYKQSQNAGPGAAKNLGLKCAQGEYITFCDSDDWIEADAYNYLMENDTVNRDVYVFGYFRDIYNVDGDVIESNLVKTEKTECFNRKEIIFRIPTLDQNRVFSFAWNKLYKRELIENNDVKFSNKKFGEDYDFNIEFFKYANSMYVSEKGYYHYIKKSTESLTERYVPDFFEINNNRFLRMKNLMKMEDCYDQTKELILTAYIKHVLAAVARLYDKRGNLTFKSRVEKTKYMLADNLSKEARIYAKSNGIGSKVCNAVFKTNCVLIVLLFGYALWIMQTKGKKFFERIK